MQIERVSYRDLSNCYRLSNGVIELIIPADVGIRIIRFGFVGDRNEFFETDLLSVPMDKNTFQLYGGHRLWHAPEQNGRTNVPDNEPITIEDHGDFIRLIQPVDITGIAKQIDIRFAADSASVDLSHRLENRGLWDVSLAVWSLSVMRAGGKAILPLPPRGSHPQDLLPASTLALWAYTDLSDPRWQFGRKYLYLSQDGNFALPQKIGLSVPSGWAAYANAGHLFVKQFDYTQGEMYPDLGSNVELFTNSEMLELETLSPLVTLSPSGSSEHKERWTLAQDLPAVETDDDVDQYVLPVMK